MKRKTTGTTKTPVKGGWVERDATSGRLIQASGTRGSSKLTPRSDAAAKEASSRRSAALKRLADR